MPLLAQLFSYRYWLLGLVAIVGVSSSVGTWALISDAEEQRVLAAFRRRADSQIHLVRVRLQLYEEMVQNLHNLVAYSEDVTRHEFEHASANLLRRFPGVRALQWLVPVPAAEVPAFLAAAQREYPDYRLSERTPSGELQPIQPRDEYIFIRLVTPLAGNERALGYDVRTSPNGDVLTRARQHRSLAISQPFRLIQANPNLEGNGVVFALAVFNPDHPDQLRGFVQGVFNLQRMLAATHRTQPDDTLLLHYVDLDAPPTFSVLYVNQAGREIPPSTFQPPGAVRPDEQVDEIITIGQRRWQLTIRLNPAWKATQLSFTPWLALGGGLCTTLITLFSLNILLRHGRAVEQQVALRTTELRTTQRALEEDIQRRRDTEAALHASEGRLQAILDYSPALIFIKDLDGRYLLVNRQYERTIGRARAQIVGRRDSDLFPPDVAELMMANDRQVLDSDKPLEFEEIAVLPDRTMNALVHKFPLKDARGLTYALGGIVTDVTQRKKADDERQTLERRLQAKQRLESLGVLAGGIAHDFNNILTGVLGNASLVRSHLPPDAPAAPLLQQIEIAARRAADLCTKMLAYAGKGGIANGSIDLAVLVRDTLALLEPSLAKSITIKRLLDDGLPAVQGDATQLRQIVMNLVLNAAEAIGHQPGEIALSTFRVAMSSADLRGAVEHPELPSGDYVALEVRDSGCGMAPEVFARIFEPFYTTKFSGRGLGLSAVLGIVRSHRGALFVHSAPGQGSVFRLVLPARGESLRAAPPEPPAPAGATRLHGRVLVVDDEPTVRDVARRALARLGLEVLEAQTGEAALQLLQERDDDIDLVLLDLSMPGLSGEDTLREMQRLRRRAKIILMSGYLEDAATRRCLNLGATAFVQKPFELPRLVSLLETHLG